MSSPSSIHQRVRNSIAVATLLLAIFPHSAQAQINVWRGATSGNLNTGANWANGNVPNGAATDVLFDNTGLNQSALNLSSPITLRTFYFYGGNYTLSPEAAEVLALNGGFTQLGSGTFTINNAITDASGLNFYGTGSGDITFNGAISDSGTGATWYQCNESTITLKSTMTMPTTSTTALRVRSGRLVLSGNGAITLGAGAIAAVGSAPTYASGLFPNGAGAALILDNASVNSLDRFSANQINVPQRGLIELRGNASAASSETLGTLNSLNQGAPGVQVRVASGSGQSARLTFASLTQNGGAYDANSVGTPAIFQFLVPSGDTLGVAGTTGGRVIFTSAPGTSGASDNGLLRYGIVKNETSGGAADFATYDTTVDDGVALGVKAFTAYDYTGATAINDVLATTTKNVDQTGGITLSANRTANAIRITPTAAGQSIEMGSTRTLTLAGAGGLIFSGGSDYSINGTSSAKLTVPSAYLYINANTLTVNAPFTASGGFSKAGDGLLVISNMWVGGSSYYLGLDRGTHTGDLGSAAQDDMRIVGTLQNATFNKCGEGQLAFTGSGATTYAGTVNIIAGTLVLAKDTDALQNNAFGSGNLNLANATLAARGRAATLSNQLNIGGVSVMQMAGDQPITFTGLVQQNTASGSQTANVVNNASAALTMNGTLQPFNGTVAGTPANGFEFSGTGTTVISGVIRNGNPDWANIANMKCNVTKSGPGLLTLSGANTYSGKTTINAGYLRLDNASALGSGNLVMAEAVYAKGQNAVLELGAGNTSFTRAIGTGANQVDVGGTSIHNNTAGFASVSGTSTVNLGGAGAPVTWGSTSFLVWWGNLILGSPNVAGTVDFQNPINLKGNRTILALNGSAFVDGIASGEIANGDATARSLTKDGAGTLELTGPNTYSGGTTVAAGTLLADNTSGSATGSGAVTVASGATLGGTGTITGAVTVNGTLAPGYEGVGTLTTGPLTLSATATFAADLGSPCDKVVVNGNLNVDGTIQVANAALGSFELMSCTGTLTPGTLTVAGVPQNMTAHIDTTTLPKSLVLRLTSPTTVIMIQ